MSTTEDDPSSGQQRSSGTKPHPPDSWADGVAYEGYVGRWSRLVAPEFLAWLAVAPNGRWLDIGCGTGVLARAILRHERPAQVLAIDRSPEYVAFARGQVHDARVRFDVGDVHALSVDAGTQDAIVSGLVLNFLARPRLALAEMVRAARGGATVAAYVWDYAGEMQLMRRFWDAAVALDPQAADLDEGRRFPLCRPEALTELFGAAGLKGVEVRAIDIATRFHDFEDYWSPFQGGQGPAPSYVMSLGEEQRRALRERLRQVLPFAPDGSIPLVARAWAVRGTRSA